MKNSVAHPRSRARLHAAAINDAIRAAGLRCTTARVAVLRHLDTHREPVSLGEASEALTPDGIDRATVFRSLRDFVDAGLARRVDLGDHVYRFELVSDDAPERGPTFTCEACGTSTELPAGAVTLHKTRGAPRALERARVYVRGLCDACA